MSEPPSSGLLYAAAPLFWLSSVDPANLAAPLQVIAGAFFLGVALVARALARSIGRAVALSNGPDAKRGDGGVHSDVTRSLLTLSCLRFAGVLAVIAFAWCVVPLMNGVLLALLSPGPVAAVAAPVVSVLVAGTIYLSLVHQLAELSLARHGERLLAKLTLPIRIWRVLAAPFVALSGWLAARLVAENPVEQAQDGEAPSSGGDAHEQGWFGGLNERERQLIDNVYAFGDAVASELMVPRADVVWISTQSDFGSVLAQVLASGHTRFPLCEGTPDEVIGYVHVKDIARLHDAPPASVEWQQLMRPVTFVPESAKAVTLLTRFQQQRAHLAVVVDEFGGMAGIITLEDLLEELVGEIQDEFDRDEPEVEELADGQLRLEGGVRLEALKDRLGLNLERVEEDTVGGYVFARLAREIEVGDQVSVPAGVLVAEAVDGLRVTRVRFVPAAIERARRCEAVGADRSGGSR